MKASAIILSALVALCANPALARVPGRPSTSVSSCHTPSGTPSSSCCIPSATPSTSASTIPSMTPCRSRGPRPTGAFPWHSSTFSRRPNASCTPTGRPSHHGAHGGGPGWDYDHREPPTEEFEDFREAPAEEFEDFRPRKFKRI